MTGCRARRSAGASRRPTCSWRRRGGSASTRRDAAGVEDSHNGILAAHAAGLRTIAIPNHEFPPGEEALAAADVVLGGLDELTPDVVAGG